MKIEYTPWSWQKTDYLKLARFSVLVCHRRAGKQTTLDTPVATPTGMKTIGDLKEGDLVIGSNGKPTKVMQLHPIRWSDVYEVRTRGGTIECCKDHLWTVSNSHSGYKNGKRKRVWQTVKTEELINMGSVYLPRVKPVQRRPRSQYIPAYLMGVWLGDGCKTSFKIFGVDNEIHEDVEEYLSEMGADIKTKIYNGVTRTYGSYQGAHGPVNKYLSSIGVKGNKHIAEDYKYGSIQQRKELIRGLMDSDGTSQNHSTYSKERFCNNNEKLIDDFREVLASLGIPSSKTQTSKRLGQFTVSFKPWFNPFRLDRKACLFVPPCTRKGSLHNKILEVRKTDKVKPMRCITVDADDSLYTVGKHYELTHNTLFDVIQSIGEVMSCKFKNPHAAYFGPTRSQTKDTAWDYYKQFLRPLFNAGKVKYNESDLTITITRGEGDKAKIFLYSYENIDNIRGNYLDHAVLDEFQLGNSNIFEKVVMPMLSGKVFHEGKTVPRRGKCIITGTPAGKNYFFDLYQQGLDPEVKNWTSLMRTVNDTDIIPEDELEEYRRTMSEESFEQEYLCSFEAAIRGSFYGRNIARLKQEGRLKDFYYDPVYPVVGAWDIGFDGTAIWYCQRVGDQVRIIDVDFFKNMDVKECANTVLNKPYTYAHQLLPHDSVNRSNSDKRKSPKKTIESLGLRCKVVPRGPIDQGIHATKLLLDACVISKKCDKRKKMGKTKISPLDSLSLYAREYDAETSTLKKENKGESHGHLADALRTLAMGLKDVRINTAQIRANMPNRPNPTVVQNTWNPFKRRR